MPLSPVSLLERPRLEPILEHRSFPSCFQTHVFTATSGYPVGTASITMRGRIAPNGAGSSTFVLLAHDGPGCHAAWGRPSVWVRAAVAKREGKACKTLSAVQIRPAAPNFVASEIESKTKRQFMNKLI
jgi:hypothetical protein